MLVWIIFISAILAFMVVDLGVFNRKAHVISLREATTWTLMWVFVALVFASVIYLIYKNALVENIDSLSPRSAVIKYITGYLIELSLSVDNIFIMAVIFSTFSIPAKYQHRVLFWGILGAIVFRLLMILFGVMLIHKFDWITYVFGAFLLYTAVNMFIKRNKESDFRHSLIYKLIKRMFPVTDGLKGQRFFLKYKGKIIITPLLVALRTLIIFLTTFLISSPLGTTLHSSDRIGSSHFLISNNNLFFLKKYSFLLFCLFFLFAFALAFPLGFVMLSPLLLYS